MESALEQARQLTEMYKTLKNVVLKAEAEGQPDALAASNTFCSTGDWLDELSARQLIELQDQITLALRKRITS